MTEAPHQFWSTQPVLSGLSKDADGPINIDSYYDNASQEPLALPEGYAWSDLDVDDSHQLQELTTFLQGHYVEDRGSKYRLSYPAEFLTWALKPPGYKSSLHLGIRSITDKSLVGFISGIPFHMQVYAQ
jgi:glycylpeptide N-tetradecanoyltransferase